MRLNRVTHDPPLLINIFTKPLGKKRNFREVELEEPLAVPLRIQTAKMIEHWPTDMYCNCAHEPLQYKYASHLSLLLINCTQLG